MRQSFGLLVLVGLLGAATPFGASAHAQAPAPARKAYNGVVKPIGPYTPGVAVGDTIYLSGQIGLDPATNQLVAGGTAAEARRVMDNLGAVLKEAGVGYGHVVKATIYMVDLAEFAAVNEIYGTYFPAGTVAPVRSTVQVAALPRGARIEIDFIAVR